MKALDSINATKRYIEPFLEQGPLKPLAFTKPRDSIELHLEPQRKVCVFQ